MLIAYNNSVYQIWVGIEGERKMNFFPFQIKSCCKLQLFQENNLLSDKNLAIFSTLLVADLADLGSCSGITFNEKSAKM